MKAGTAVILFFLLFCVEKTYATQACEPSVVINEIRGRVTDDHHNAISNLSIRLYKIKGKSGCGEPGKLYASTTTGVGGTFSFLQLTPGTYAIYVDEEGKYSHWETFDVIKSRKNIFTRLSFIAVPIGQRPDCEACTMGFSYENKVDYYGGALR